MKYLLPILLLPAFAVAEESIKKSELIDTVISAKSVSRVKPRYPIQSARNGQEGWVKLSYVIDKEGKVLDPVVQDSSGLEAFEKSALRAIKKWTFSPAIRDGKAIEQCKMSVQMDFKLDTGRKKSLGVTRKFARSYREVNASLNDKNYELAQKQLTELGEQKKWNMDENAWYWMLDSVYASEVGDELREMRSLGRAINGGGRALAEGTYSMLLDRLFSLQVQHGRYSKSLLTWDRLSKLDGNEESIARLAPYAEKVRDLINGSEPLVMQATIRKSGSWFHSLSRKAFTLVDVEGELDEVELRCDNKRSRFTVDMHSEWKIPHSWGKCTVLLKGSENTNFKLVELAHET